VRLNGEHIELWPSGKYEEPGEGASAVIGLSLREHHETLLVDRAGHLQLPRDLLDRVPFNGRALVRLVGEHIELWPPSASTLSGVFAEEISRGKETQL
jgi:hypothetical protein